MANLSGNFTPLPLLPNGRVDAKSVRKAYDDSPYLEFPEFCRGMGYELAGAYAKLKPAVWVARKRERLVVDAKCRIQNFATTHRGRWIDQVKDTLEDYPKVIDNIMALVAKQVALAHDPKSPPMKPYAVAALAQAAKTCVEAKKSILFLNTIVLELENSIPTTGDAAGDFRQSIVLRGGKGLTLDQARLIMRKYLDQPHDEDAAPVPPTHKETEPEECYTEPEVLDADD